MPRPTDASKRPFCMDELLSWFAGRSYPIMWSNWAPTSLKMDGPGGGHSSITEVEFNTLLSAVAMARPSTILEVGTGFGVSTLAMALALRHNKYGKLLSVDHRSEACGVANHLLWWHNVSGYAQAVVGESPKDIPSLLAKWLEHSQLDMIFVDGTHTAQAISADIDIAYPFMNNDAWLYCHDYGRVPVEVRQRINTQLGSTMTKCAGSELDLYRGQFVCTDEDDAEDPEDPPVLEE